MKKHRLKETLTIQGITFSITLKYYYEDGEYFEDIELGNKNLKKVLKKYKRLKRRARQ